MAGRKSILVLAAAILFFALPANADLTISSKPTQNVSCSSGVCTATAKKAELNVGELTAMLGSGDVTVSTGSIAKDIEVSAPLSWANGSRLTLAADKSLVVKQPTAVAGPGALTLSSNGGHQKVDLEFFGKGNIEFWDLSSSLIINGESYTLVGDIATLAADIAANPSGSYALAKPYDASADGTYVNTPVTAMFTGRFEGLGNAIMNLSISVSVDGNYAGLFLGLGQHSMIRDLALTNISLQGSGCNDVSIGAIVVVNEGLLENDSATGSIEASCIYGVGGLTEANYGTILSSRTHMLITTARLTHVGGLAGWSQGSIQESFSDSRVRNSDGAFEAGGIVALNRGTISDSYALKSVRVSHDPIATYAGGLVGENDGSFGGSLVSSSYSIGAVRSVECGGLVGYNSGTVSTSYWDLDTSNCGGAGQGISDQQLKSGLPAGFDPKIWGQDTNVNSGYPYLIANPP